MKRVLAFGEILKRNTIQQPIAIEKIDFKRNDYERSFGGAEANVLIGLSHLGDNTAFLTALPKNQDGDDVLNLLKQYHVDTDFIQRRGNKLGQYFLIPQAKERKFGMIYDRDNSSVTEIKEDEIDYDSLFRDISVFHISGISFSLKGYMKETSFRLIKEARKRKIPISFDYNYRERLWFSRKKEAPKLYQEIAPYPDIALASDRDLKTFLLFKGNSMEELAKEYFLKYPNTKYLILRNRKRIADDIHVVDAGIFTKKEHFRLPHPFYFNVKEKVGGGDSFNSGILHALLHSYSLEETLYYAISTFELKHQMKGDLFLGNDNMVQEKINENKRRKKIALSITSLDPSFSELEKSLQELADIDILPVDVDNLKGYDIFIGKKMSEKALETADRLQIVFAYKTGVDDFPLKKLKEKNIIVCNSHADSDIIAEYAFGLAISLVNKITESDRKLRQGIWYDKENLYWESLFRKKVGLLGYGHIGKEIHKILKNNAIDTYTIDRGHQYENIKLVKDFDELVSTCDVIICSLPKTGETNALFSKEVFKRMKGKYIINVGRSNCIDQKDLYDALKNHELSGVAIDTWDKKPSTMDELLLPSIYPLHTLENIIVSPHQAMKVIDGHHRYVMDVLNNVKNYLLGEGLHSIVDLSKGY